MEELLRFRWVNSKEDYRPPASIILFRIVHKLGDQELITKMNEYLKLRDRKFVFSRCMRLFYEKEIKPMQIKNRLEAKKQVKKT